MSNQSTNKKPGRKAAQPITRLIQLREAGLTHQEIGDMCGCSKANVHTRLKAVKADFKGLAVFKDKKADILALFQQKMLYSLTPDDIKRMPGGSRVLAMCQLYDKERTERGQPGAYVQYSDFGDELEEVNKEIEGLELELAALGG